MSLLAAQGCQTIKPNVDAERPTPAAAETPGVALPYPEPEPVRRELDEDLVFSYLVGEIAARRGAARAFLQALPDVQSVSEAMAKMGLAWGHVRNSVAMDEQPTVRHRGTLTDVDDRGGGRRRVVQSPYRFSAADSGVRSGAPHQGEHNAEVLSEWLALEPDEIDTLADAGVLITRRR